MIEDFWLEEICKKVVNNGDNHFAVSLHKRGKTGLPYLIMQVMREIPKDELSNDLLVKINSTLVRVMDSTSN
jgi:hypothetical protein